MQVRGGSRSLLAPPFFELTQPTTMKHNREKRDKAQNVGGNTLAGRLASCGALPEADVIPILSQLLRELRALHAEGRFHLGLCPDSVLVREDGGTYLADAAAAKWSIPISGAGEASHLRLSGYEAPELQGRRMESVGPWTDFYALGATLYRLLTNAKVPELTMILDEGDDAFEFPEGVSDRMRELILHLMKPNRRQRPQSVDELEDWILPELEFIAIEEIAADEAETEVVSDNDDDGGDDDGEHRWYHLDREDLHTLLFVVGFTALLLLYKALA